MAGVMMLPAVALLGWTRKERASGPVPPPPPPPIAMPRLLVSRPSYGQPTATSAFTTTVTPQSLLLISNHPLLRFHMIVKRAVRRKGARHPFVHLAGHVGRQIPGPTRNRGTSCRCRATGLEPAILVGESGRDGFEHPWLHLDRRLRDDDAAHRALRREAHRHLDRTVRRVHAHELECAHRRRPGHAPVEHQYAVLGTPVHGFVQPVRIRGAQVYLPGHVSIGPRQ